MTAPPPLHSVKKRNQANEMIISLGMTADLIGEETSSSALVFGLMSLTDKVKLTVNVNMHTLFVINQHFITTHYHSIYSYLLGC